MMVQLSQQYPTDLTDQQWELIKHILPSARKVGRRRTTSLRQVINAILYLTRSGCAWRYLPKEYPPWQTVYDYFRLWRDKGVWRTIHNCLAIMARLNAGRSVHPNLTIIDGQSVKAQYGEERGYDGFKKVRGRKRQILVDSLGIIWAARVHRANQQESTRGHEVVEDYPNDVKIPSILLGDSGYGKAPFDVRVKQKWDIWPEIRKGCKTHIKNEIGHLRPKLVESNLKPKRWIVERTFAWMNNTRRLARDYEKKVTTSECFLFLSQIPQLLNRLAAMDSI